MDGLWIRVDLDGFTHGALLDSSITIDAGRIGKSARILSHIVGAGARASVGLVATSEGDWQLAWLLSEAGNLIPPTCSELRKKGWRLFLRWLPWVLLAGTASAVSIAYMTVSFAFVVLMMLASVVLIVCSIDWVYGLVLIAGSYSRTVHASERALQRAHRFNGQPMDDAQRLGVQVGQLVCAQTQAASALPADTDSSGVPCLRRLSGCARHISVLRQSASQRAFLPTDGGGVSVSGGLNYKAFTFMLEKTPCVVFASRNFGGGTFFLAEGDQVEVVLSTAANDECSKAPALVWAMRNLVDGKVYACHRIMSPVANAIATPLIGKNRMTQVTPRYLKGMRSYALVVWVCAILLVAGIMCWGSGPGDDTHGTVLATVLGSGPPAIWIICFELPIRAWRWKWRMGYPSKRQRLAMRVYELLGAGSPLKPDTNVVDI
jgi:hypothetical protein